MINKIKDDIKEVLSKELDIIDLDKAMNHIISLLSDYKFERELNNKIDKLSGETKDRDSLICLCIMIGLGRNRTIDVIKDYKVTRGIFEMVRDSVGLKTNETKEENERVITSFKWKTKSRSRRKKKLSGLNWDKVKERYLNGEFPNVIGKDNSVSPHLITNELKDEGLFDYNRSTITKNKVAKSNSTKIDNKFIEKLMKENQMLDMNSIWEKAKKEYPWLLRKQFLDKVEDLGLKRSIRDVNQIKSLKSKTSSNKSYQVKVKSYRAVNHVFGSDEILTSKYLKGELGGYRKIADKINNEIDFEFSITPRQVERIIRGSDNYKSKKSSGQTQLSKFIKKTFNNYEIIEEYTYNGNKRIDIYIPELEIGFEYNGDYWHSNAMIEYNYGKPAYEHHEERVNEANKLGIRLMYVWENDWNNLYEEIEEVIRNKDWDNEILNKYESECFRKFKFSEERDELFSLITEYLEDKKIDYKLDINDNKIDIKDLFININTNTRF